MVQTQEKGDHSTEDHSRNVIEIRINMPSFNANNLRRFITHLEKAGKELIAAGTSFLTENEDDEKSKTRKIEIK